ncbi:MAG: CinA family protein [Oscillospiraceae bacterium]|nr:CinA family protein [Oscillospiraceae bacterium]
MIDEIRSMKLQHNLKKLVKECTGRGIKVATAESCTGGMISEWITSVPGSSAVIEFGICSYSNRIKHKILGVSEETLEKYTEYSIQCAEEMAKGALKVSGADFAVSTTGIAGPSGGTDKDPVGTVYICVCDKHSAVTRRFVFDGEFFALSRNEIRIKAAKAALKMLLNKITERGK